VDCVNLQEHFGADYKITWDPAHLPRESPDPWLMQIPARYGAIFPHGGELLAVEIDGHARVAARVRALLGVTIHQNGDSEWTFLFNVDQFDAVAAIVGPRRRRQLTEADRARLAEMGRGTRFTNGAVPQQTPTTGAVERTEPL
jgi:hypothetical protein